MSNLLTPELIADFEDPTDVTVSPDGEWALYALTPASKKGEHPCSSLWRVRVDGDTQPEALTHGQWNDRAARFSPDGTRVAFLSDRTQGAETRGTSRIYLLPLGGGEPRRLTQDASNVQSMAWSPNGLQVAFLAVPPQSPEAEQRKNARDDATVFGERKNLALLHVLQLDSGESRVIGPTDQHCMFFAWSPNGQSIAIQHRDTSTGELLKGDHTALSIVDVKMGKSALLTQLTAGWIALQWPVDDAILITDSVDGYRHASLPVYALNPESGHRLRVLGGIDSCALLCAPTNGADGRALLLEARGLDTAAWLRERSGELIPLPIQFSGEPASIHAAAGTVAWTESTLQGGVDIFAHKNGKASQLTHSKPLLANMQLGAVEPFHWQAPDGLALDGVLIRPVNAGAGPWPMMVQVHGGPYLRFTTFLHASWFRWGQMLAQRGIAVLLPNYRGGLGRGAAFAAMARSSMGLGSFQDITSAVDAAVERGIAISDRVGIGGWSAGGYMTAWAVTQTDRFRCGIMGAGVCDWGTMFDNDIPAINLDVAGTSPWDEAPEDGSQRRHVLCSPINYAKRVRTPLLILHGERDLRVPVNQSRLFHRAMLENGIETEFVTYPREPHIFQERMHQIDLMQRVLRWTTRWLGPAPT